MSKHLPFLSITILYAFVGMKALFHPGLFTAHDIWHQVARFYHFKEALLDGQFPPYWIDTLANGFGYPLFFFSYHLPWILGAPFLFLGFDIPTIIKLLFFISFISSGIFMYFWGNELFRNRLAALVSSLLYMWAPYHFSTLLVSAAIGQAFVFSFLPLLFWGMYKIANRHNVSGTILVAFGTSGIILSHLMTTISLIPLIGVFTFWLIKTFPRNNLLVKRLLLAFVLGISLSAFYLLPAIFYSRETQVTTGAFNALYQKQFVDLGQLIYSKWGYGIAERARDGAISYQVGIAQWLSVFVSILALITIKRFHLIEKTSHGTKTLGIALITMFIFPVFMMIDASRPIWDFVSNFITLDYPTMFLLPAVFTGSLLGGYLLTITNLRLKGTIFITLILITLYTNRNHLNVNQYTNIPVSLYVASETTTNSYHEYLPKSADIKLFNEPHPSAVISDVPISEISRNTRGTSFSMTLDKMENITLNHFSFPGINLYINGEKKAFDLDGRGRIMFLLPSGKYHIRVLFEETPLIKIAKLITIGTLVYLILLSIKGYVKKTQI